MSTKRGYFAVGVYHPKWEVNTGTLWRSAYAMGAAFTFTVGARFDRQSSDTAKSHRHCPMFNFDTTEDLIQHLPYSCPLVGVELTDDAAPLDNFVHPERACYLLGAEDHGLPPSTLERCHRVVVIPDCRLCLNVAVAGSIVLHDRTTKARARSLAADSLALSRSP